MVTSGWMGWISGGVSRSRVGYWGSVCYGALIRCSARDDDDVIISANKT